MLQKQQHKVINIWNGVEMSKTELDFIIVCTIVIGSSLISLWSMWCEDEI